MYVQRVYHRPVPGKGPELRAALEERVRIEIEKGTRINLFSQVVLPHGPQFLVITAHESAEALEKWRDANSSDQVELGFRAQTAPLRSGAVQTRLLKMLIPSAQRSASDKYLHISHINPLPDKEGTRTPIGALTDAYSPNLVLLGRGPLHHTVCFSEGTRALGPSRYQGAHRA